MDDNQCYFTDLLDSVRCPALSAQRAANENRLVALSNLMISVMLGEVPVLSQTQAFDSSIILDVLCDDKENYAFLKLVRDGYIQVRLFGGCGSLLGAFCEACMKKGFVFSGWPEIAEKGGSVEGKALVARIRGEPTQLPDAVLVRLNALRALSDAVEQSPVIRAQNARRQFYDRLIDVKNCYKCERDDLDIHQLLEKCVVKHADTRSKGYEIVDRAEVCDFVKESVRQILDACYNLTVCDSLRVGHAKLTTDRIAVVNVVMRSLSKNTEKQSLFLSPEVKGLETLSWKHVKDFVETSRKCSRPEKENRALAAACLAKVVCENGGYICRPSLPKKIVFGGMTVAGFLCGNAIDAASGDTMSSHAIGRSIEELLTSGIAWPIATSVGNSIQELQLRHVKGKFVQMLERGVR